MCILFAHMHNVYCINSRPSLRAFSLDIGRAGSEGARGVNTEFRGEREGVRRDDDKSAVERWYPMGEWVIGGREPGPMGMLWTALESVRGPGGVSEEETESL